MFGTRLLSLILAFFLGFSLCGGIIAFGAMAAISKFRVRDLEKHGINIPDEAFMTEDREVDLFNLSIVEFIDEVKYVSSLGEQVTIEFIQDRYGILIHEKIDGALTEETKKMPLKQLLTKDGVTDMLGGVYIGNVENYTCYNADGTVGGDPKDDSTYWMTADGVKITGIEDIIADFSIGDFISGNINTNTLFDEIHIGDILGYSEKDGEWVDKDGNKVTGVIGAFAGSTIHSVGTDVNNVLIGDVLGYEQDENGDWYKTNDAGEREKVTGVLGVFAGSKINEIGGKIEDAKLGELLGYELDEESGDWYKTNDAGEREKVTGVIATFADSGINEIGDKLEEAKLGEILGYELEEESGDWYKTNDAGISEKVTGVLAVFADCNINGIGDKLETAKLGEILGYEFEEESGDWYKTNDENEREKVTGVMAVFADSGINSIGDKLETSKLGELLGYDLDESSGDWYKTNDKGESEKVTGVMAVFSDCNIDGIGDKLETAKLGELLGYDLDEASGDWYKTNDAGEREKVTGAMAVFADSNINGVGDEIEKTQVGKLLGYELKDGTWYKPADVLDEHGNRVPVDGFMSKISASTINNMDGVFETLVIGDVVKDTDEGLFSIIDPDTKIDEIGSAVNDSIMDSPLQFFINQKLISFETGEGENKQDMSETLDFMSTNDLAKIYPTDEDFNTQKNYYSEVWTEVKSGDTVLYYTVPNWRTQPLSTSFAYIIKLFATPSLPISE